MNTLLEIPELIYVLLIELACGIALAAQFAPGERAYLRQQALVAFTFLFLAPILSLALGHTLPGSALRWEIYGIGLLGTGLIADFWLKFEPGAKAFEKIVGYGLSFAALLLLYATSLPYKSGFIPFFLFLGGALLSGSIWLAMTDARYSALHPGSARGTSFYYRLLFLCCSGFVVIAIFTPLCLGQPQSQNQLPLESLTEWHAWHCGLAGIGLLTFLVGLYRARQSSQNTDIIPGLPSMGFAFIFALLGEACGLAAFLSSHIRT